MQPEHELFLYVDSISSSVMKKNKEKKERKKERKK